METLNNGITMESIIINSSVSNQIDYNKIFKTNQENINNVISF